MWKQPFIYIFVIAHFAYGSKILAAANETAAIPPADSDNAYALEEIRVYARKKTEDLQQVPVSVTGLTSDNLVDRGIYNFD